MKQHRPTIFLIGLAFLATLLFSQADLTNAITRQQPVTSIQTAPANQSIPLDTGWNMISSYIEPDNPALETLLAGIENDMLLIKNGAGDVYWPGQGINNIGTWDVLDGYLIYMNNAVNLSITGSEIDPALTPINLLEGSNLIAYLRSQPMPVNQAFAGVPQFLMAKNGQGKVYWPDFGVNQIGDMQPGQGYEVYMTGSGVLYYADPANTPTPTPIPSCNPNPANILANPSFENGTTSWTFYTNGSGNFSSTGPAAHCDNAARLTFNTINNNMQLYQQGFSIQEATNYRLSFSAFSNTGHDLQINVQRHSAPYTNYGLSNQVFNLSNSWQDYSVEFTTTGFIGTTTDTRLRFWFVGNAANGDIYWIDNVVLEQIGGTPPPTATSTPVGAPTSTPTPTPTSTPSSGGGGGNDELLVFDWNKPVTESNRGFPFDQPPIANGDWTQPVNYAQGTLYYRVEIFSQPEPQNMKLQFCFWQAKNGYNFELEMCGPQQSVQGTPGTVATWSVAVENMWKKDGKSIEWWRERFRNGAAIKNSSGLPVSNYNGWNWNGEDPKKWYPLNMRFLVVVVAKDGTFSGWQNYID